MAHVVGFGRRAPSRLLPGASGSSQGRNELCEHDPDPGVEVLTLPSAVFLTVIFCRSSCVDDVICGLLQRPDKSVWKEDGTVLQSSARQPGPALPAAVAREEGNTCSVQVRPALRATLGVYSVIHLCP